MSNQKTKRISYRIVTGLLVFELAFGALWDLNIVNKGYALGIIKHLGYPPYLVTILGICKLIAASIIISPKLLLAKEWVYAGVVILFSGAIASHLSSGDGIAAALHAIIILCVTLCSWFLRPAERRVSAIKI